MMKNRVKNKLYVVINEDGQTSYYDSWNACSAMVKGVPGVRYKGFKTEQEAKAWVGLIQGTGGSSRSHTGELLENKYYAFVDGSYSRKTNEGSWGLVVVCNNETVHEANGIVPEKNHSHNIDGELYGARQAIEWANLQKIEVTIVYDYQGIEAWAKGIWNAKSEVAQKYIADIQGKLHCIHFEKVKAHTGVDYNEMADRLAKDALGIK